MNKAIILCLIGVFIISSYGAIAGEPMKLVMLGTGTPAANPERAGPALAIIKNDKSYLIDIGVGIVRRAASAFKKHDISSLEAKNLNMAFITHLHTDHTIGLADLVFSPWVLGRTQPLKLFGPTGTKEMAFHIIQAYQADIDIRLNGLEPASPEGYKVETTEFTRGGTILETADIKVDAVPVIHGAWQNAYGFVFSDGDTKIVISGDAAPSPALIEAATGADILVHEVFSTEKFKDLPEEWQKYHAAFHTSTHQLAEIAKQAQPKLLVLYHQLFWGATDEDLIREIRQAGYQGKVISARDLDLY